MLSVIASLCLLLIAAGVVVSIFGLPFLVSKLTRLENKERHWWNLTWSYIAQEGAYLRYYLLPVLGAPTFLIFLFSTNPSADTTPFVVAMLLCSVAVLAFNKNVRKAHQVDAKLRMWTRLYLIVLVCSLAILLTGPFGQTLLLLCWPILSLLWGFRVLVSHVSATDSPLSKKLPQHNENNQPSIKHRELCEENAPENHPNSGGS